MKKLIDKITKDAHAEKHEFLELLNTKDKQYLFDKAKEVCQKNYGNKIYIRGLIEVSSYCKNDCYYCGLRKSNKNAQRYRLTKAQILSCCEIGYEEGFRTFVMQGGEDNYYNDQLLVEIVSEIKKLYPDCAITLSLGEKTKEQYQKYFDAGADRYLLRHETATKSHYEKLHPENMAFENRMRCLSDLKEIGFQTGVGFMVGSPYQTDENLAEDLYFVQNFKPHMIGIGPFIPHCDTPFGEFSVGSVEKTLVALSLLRLTNPKALLPATTALGTAQQNGRILGVLAGANIVMPNISPKDTRDKYMLYNNKLSTGLEAGEYLAELKKSFAAVGYDVEVSRGDSLVSNN